MLPNRIASILVCLGLLFATGCQANTASVSQTPVSTIITTPEMSLTVTPPSSGTMPTYTPAPTVTPQKVVLPTDSMIHNQCPEISTEFVPGKSTGILAVNGRSSRARLLNLETGKKDFLGGSGAVVSPSRKQFAYWGLDPNTGRNFLAVSTSDNIQIKQLPLQKGWITMPRWQDDQHLLIRIGSASPPYSVAVFNPFTGETKKLVPDFPNISLNDVDWDFSGPAAYDQTMDYVIYAASNGTAKLDEYVLWLISSQTKIASLPGSSYNGSYLSAGQMLQKDGVSNNPPRWSPDNTRVAVVSPAPGDQTGLDEIFAITKAGEIQRMTYFAKHFEKAKIGAMNWSPDGKKIAFWVTLEPSPYKIPQGAYQNARLTVLDTATLEMMYTCIPGDNIGVANGTSTTFFLRDVPAPIWSPDGKQIVIENRYTDEASRLILLDIPSGTAVVIGKNMEPTGWMLDK
jgi:hypothetical protein